MNVAYYCPKCDSMRQPVKGTFEHPDMGILAMFVLNAGICLPSVSINP